MEMVEVAETARTIIDIHGVLLRHHKIPKSSIAKYQKTRLVVMKCVLRKLFVVSLLLLSTPVVAASSFLHQKLIVGSPEDVVAGRFIVTFQPGADPFAVLSRQAVTSRPDVNYVQFMADEPLSDTAFLQDVNDDELESLLEDPEVLHVEPDRYVQPHVAQTISWIYGNWGLDRIDNPGRNFDRRYRFVQSGENVEIYVFDTGAEQNDQFEDRLACGYDDGGGDCGDAIGHGTHVAAIAGGYGYGVAKGIEIIAVRVLSGKEGNGSISSVLRGMDYVIGQKKTRPETPMVVNMSLGTSYSPAMNLGVSNLVANGVVVIVSAGNDNDDACKYSPASAADAITVGSVDRNNKRSSFSNHGSCVDIFAPGSDIQSAARKGGFFSTGGTSKSGTSMAAPFVAGAAALFMEQNPAMTPAEVRQQMIDDHGVRNVVDDARGSPDVMVSTGTLYEASSAALSSSQSNTEMCSGVFGYCGGGIGCCGDKFCLPVFGLCLFF